MTKITAEARKYKYVGHEVPGTKIDRILLKGTSSNPEDYIDLNGPSVELSDADHKKLVDQGYKLHKTGGPPLDEKSDSNEKSKSDESK